LVSAGVSGSRGPPRPTLSQVKPRNITCELAASPADGIYAGRDGRLTSIDSSIIKREPKNQRLGATEIATAIGISQAGVYRAPVDAPQALLLLSAAGMSGDDEDLPDRPPVAALGSRRRRGVPKTRRPNAAFLHTLSEAIACFWWSGCKRYSAETHKDFATSRENPQHDLLKCPSASADLLKPRKAV
jgi:hypothetical protein